MLPQFNTNIIPCFLEINEHNNNNKVSHGTFNLTFRMLQHTFSEVTVTKYDET